MEKPVSQQVPEMAYGQPPVYHTPPPQDQIYQAPPMQAPYQQATSPPPQQPAYGQYQQPMGQPMGQPMYQPMGQPMHQPMQQAQLPMQAQAQGSQQFKSVTPIASLGRGAAPVDCPACGQREMTNISYEAGNTTHAWALVACFCFCLGCIPYLLNSLKDVQHKCGKCGVLLATWHRSGNTEVHIHS